MSLLAIIATVAWWTGSDISALAELKGWWPDQPWRLLSSALPHVDLFHLTFNLYWLWVFGTLIEDKFGAFPSLALVVFLAGGSAAAEYAFLAGGVGLSGVGYGLFGFLWVLGRKDRRFAGVIDRPTTVLFVAWFFFCILLTLTEVMRVGNIAHGAGALLGALLAWSLVGHKTSRMASAATLLATLVGIGAASSVWRPYVNLSRDFAQELAAEGYEALTRQDNARAAELYRKAVARDAGRANYWYNLGVALMRLGRADEAAEAFEKSLRLDPENCQARHALESVRAGKQRTSDSRN